MSSAGPSPRRALVVGLGISGMSTAIALRKAGWTPVVVERAASRRRGGYSIGLFGTGKSAAGRLGILANMPDRSPRNGATFEIDRRGRRRPAFGFADQPGQPWLMMRGDVEQAAFAALDDIEVRFSTVPIALDQYADGVEATLAQVGNGATTTERFDLVVGADGLRSSVRDMVFGPRRSCLHPLNHMIAAFELPGDLPGVRRGEGAVLAEPGRSFWIFPFADHPSTVLFSYHTDDVDREFRDPPAQRLREVYGPEPLGPTMGAAVDVLAAGPDYLFDSVEQVRLDRWHRGRVALVGDAAWCSTLYSGMGISSGIAGAELLGSLLGRHGEDVATALAEWEQTMRPYVDYYQAVGVRSRAIFTPSTRSEMAHRWLFMQLRRFAWGSQVLRWADNGKDLAMRSADIGAA